MQAGGAEVLGQRVREVGAEGAAGRQAEGRKQVGVEIGEVKHACGGHTKQERTGMFGQG